MSWDLRRYIGTLDTYVLMTDVDALSLAAITELNIPGLNVETSSVRQYNTTLAAHILGTIGKMDGTDWETYESKGYAMDAYIGKDGAGAGLRGGAARLGRYARDDHHRRRQHP